MLPHPTVTLFQIAHALYYSLVLGLHSGTITTHPLTILIDHYDFKKMSY